MSAGFPVVAARAAMVGLLLGELVGPGAEATGDTELALETAPAS
jgi:hypothetical protein